MGIDFIVMKATNMIPIVCPEVISISVAKEPATPSTKPFHTLLLIIVTPLSSQLFSLGLYNIHGRGMIIVIEILPYDFLLSAARLNKSQFCAVVIRSVSQSATFVFQGTLYQSVSLSLDTIT